MESTDRQGVQIVLWDIEGAPHHKFHEQRRDLEISFDNSHLKGNKKKVIKFRNYYNFVIFRSMLR